MSQIWASIGSNIDRETHICGALDELGTEFGTLVVSPVYETDAVGFDGAAFLNLVVGFDSALQPAMIVSCFHEIEARHARERSAGKFSSRTLDLDLLTWGDRVLETDQLVLPRDEICKYAFVLRPLADVAPDQIHPLTRQTFLQMWQQLDSSDQGMKEISLDCMG